MGLISLLFASLAFAQASLPPAVESLGAAVEAGLTFQRLEPSQFEKLQKNLQAALNPSSKIYLENLADNGWNSSGGGGGIACFASLEHAKNALDSYGRMKREMIPKLVSLHPFEIHELVDSNWDLKTNMLNGHEIPFHAVLPGESVEQYLSRNVSQAFQPLAPVLAESLLLTLQNLSFSTWQASSKQGLPFFPDLSSDPADAVQFHWPTTMSEGLLDAVNPCVYVQLAIRFDSKESSPLKDTVQIVYDEALIQRMKELSSSEEDYTQKLSTLVLHESAYFLYSRLGPLYRPFVPLVVSHALIGKFDRVSFLYNYYTRQRDSLGRVLALGYLEDYKKLLAEDGSYRADLYNAWAGHVMRAEKRELKANAAGDSTIGYFGWRGLEFPEYEGYLSDYSNVSRLTPVQAMAASLVTISLNGAIPNPESIFAYSEREHNYLADACAFVNKKGENPLLRVPKLEWSSDPDSDELVQGVLIDLISEPKAAAKMLSLVQEYCAAQGNKSN